MDINQNEKELKYSHKPINFEEMKIISNQMNKYICKIRKNPEIGTGFFCTIPLEQKKIQVLIITIIEITKEDNINYFLDLDEDLFSENSEMSYESESIYFAIS